jgi:hypothetical protein
MSTITRPAVEDAEAIRLAGVLAGVDIAYGDAVHDLVLRLIDERDRARSIAVRVEQEATELRRALAHVISGDHRRVTIQDGDDPETGLDVCARCLSDGDTSWPCHAITVDDADRDVRTHATDSDWPF